MGGVFISEGMGLRIPAGGLTIGVGEDGQLTSSITFEVALDVWPMWLDVALDHAVQAAKVRLELEDAVRSAGESGLEGKDQAALMTGECQAGMVSIAAAAFALDNFHSTVRRFVPGSAALEAQWAQANTARHRRVSESLRRTFRVTNDGAKKLRRSVGEIFRFRDWAVHPPADFRVPLKHDLLDSGVEWRFVAFRAGNAVRATGAATAIISQCISAPRAGNDELMKWCSGRKGRIEPRMARARDELREYEG